MIELFTANTPNGIKIPIALEELGQAYEIRNISLGSAELRSAEYLQINPNAKIPAIRHYIEAGEEVTVFESGAILTYLGDTFGGLLGDSPPARAQTLSWLFLQVAGLGPAMGQAAHFGAIKAPDPYTIGRFQGEASRLLRLLEARLQTNDWLNGATYSLADIANFSWVRSAAYAGFDLADFPTLNVWVEKIELRPATQRALARLHRSVQT